MAQPFDDVRPALLPTTQVRLRADGSAGLFDPPTGIGLEVAADQARLLVLLDGKRTLGEVMEAHYAAYRSTPLAALDDLLTALGERGLLVGGPPARPRPVRWLARLLTQRVLWRAALPGLPLLAVVLASAVPALAFLLPAAAPLGPSDVLLAFAGAAFAHSVRRWFQGAVVPALGAPVTHLEVGHTAGIPWLGPDPDALVLLERPRRALALLSGLVGLGVAFFVAAATSKGLGFGAAVVAVVELCPFAPTLAGRLLATLAGRVDLQEHARAYLDRRLLARAAARSTFDGETSLVWTSILSLGWLGWVVRLLFTTGAATSVRLVAVGLEYEGLDRGLLRAGAAVLLLALPLSLVALFAGVARALLALKPPAPAHAGVVERSAVDLAQVPLFARLPEAERSAVAQAGEHRRYPAQAALVVQGAEGEHFFAILSGTVGVHVEADSGLSRRVATLRAGDCFGEGALLGDGRRAATVKAESEVDVLALDRAGFARLQGELHADQFTALVRHTASLRRSAFFGGLPAERLLALAAELTARPMVAGEALLTRGEAGHECYLVAEGHVEVLGDDGRVVATLGPGDYFGEVALLRDVPRTATVRAKEAGSLLVLSREGFLAAVVRDLKLSRQVEALAAERAGGAA